MLSLPSLTHLDRGLGVRVYLATAPADMRKGFDTLAALSVYVTDGDLDIDNNTAERALRRVAIGRKNWLFCGSDAGGATAATLFTLISTCQRHQVDPFAYLRDVLARIAAQPINRLADLLPDRWKSAAAGEHAVASLPGAATASPA